jgi:hypothetical protein
MSNVLAESAGILVCCYVPTNVEADKDVCAPSLKLEL